MRLTILDLCIHQREILSTKLSVNITEVIFYFQTLPNIIAAEINVNICKLCYRAVSFTAGLVLQSKYIDVPIS